MGLFNRCQHDWDQVGQDYKAPQAFKFGGGAPPPGVDFADLIYGFTIVSLRCKHCKDVKTRKLRGKFVDDRQGEQAEAPAARA